MKKFYCSSIEFIKNLEGIYTVVRDASKKRIYIPEETPSRIKAISLDEMRDGNIIADQENGKAYSVKIAEYEEGYQTFTFFDVSNLAIENSLLKVQLDQAKREKDELLETIESLKIDATTGLSTKKIAMQDMTDYVRYANRTQEPFALVMGDIDYFKKVNDTYGHLAGNRVLHSVSDQLRSSIRYFGARKKDIIGRYGGEEFIILLKNIYGDTAYEITERMRKKIEEGKIDLSTLEVKEPISVTMSFGVCYSKDGLGDLESLVLRSDQFLYESKENGRNLVTAGPVKIKTKE